MSFSAEFLERLRLDEGAVRSGGRHVVYDDATGKPLRPGDTLQGFATVGYGINLNAGIPEKAASYLLAAEVTAKHEELMRRLEVYCTLDEVRREVLLNMAYNLGVDGLLNFKNTLTFIERGMYDAAAREMLNSEWASQVGARAIRLARQMQTGIREL